MFWVHHKNRLRTNVEIVLMEFLLNVIIVWECILCKFANVWGKTTGIDNTKFDNFISKKKRDLVEIKF